MDIPSVKRAYSCAPLSPSQKDLKSILSDLGNRQEENFKKLLQKQKELHNELLTTMQAASQANCEAQGSLQRCQESFIEEFREWSSKFSIQARSSKWNSVADMHEEKQRVAQRQSSDEAKAGGIGGFVFKSSYETDGSGSSAGKVSESDPSIISQTPSSSMRGLQLTNAWSAHGAFPNNRARVGFYLKSKEFEICVAMAVMCHAFLMFWESQYQGLEVGYQLRFPSRVRQSVDVWPGAEKAFDILGWFFGIVFLLEVILKLFSWRCKFFIDLRGRCIDKSKKSSTVHRFRHQLRHIQGWNLLDFSCVIAFLFDKIATVSAVNPQMLRLLRLFRLFRLVRLLRLLESVDHLYVMTTAISGLSRVLSWAVALLTLMLLICDLFLVQILHATYFDRVDANSLDEVSLQKHQQIYEYFGTSTRCMLSMFELTLGNWPPIVRLLSEEVSQWFTLICLLHKLTIGFAVIGVITGIILQETFKVAHTDDIIMYRQKKRAGQILRSKMKTLFNTLDEERNGQVNMKEFLSIAHDPEIKIWLSSLDIETDDLATLFWLIDEDGSGYITLDELVTRVPRIKGYARGIDMMRVMRKLRL